MGLGMLVKVHGHSDSKQIQTPVTKESNAYTAVSGVLDPPEPAPSILNMCPPFS